MKQMQWKLELREVCAGTLKVRVIYGVIRDCYGMQEDAVMRYVEVV